MDSDEPSEEVDSDFEDLLESNKKASNLYSCDEGLTLEASHFNL